MTSPDPRLDRARIALEGLSVGDAFGERFFYHPDLVGSLLDQRALPDAEVLVRWIAGKRIDSDRALVHSMWARPAMARDSWRAGRDSNPRPPGSKSPRRFVRDRPRVSLGK